MKKVTLITLALLMVFSCFFAGCDSTPAENSNPAVSDDTQNVSQNASQDASQDVSGNQPDTETSVPPSADTYPTRPEGYPTVCGTFMQPGTFAGYNLDRMTKHLEYMRQVGIEIIILQWSFATEGNKVTAQYFPASFDAADIASNMDKSGTNLVDTLLKAAESLDMKVYLGLNNDNDWWSKGVNDKAWLERQAYLGLEGAKQLHDTFKEKYPETFYGWYFVHEYYNMKANDLQLDNAAYLLSAFRDGLYEIDPTMPMMLSPFVSSGNSNAKEAGELWTKIFAKVEFREGDIFCCQDSVGAGHIMIDQLDDYYGELKKAVDTEKGLHFWANNEDFEQSNWSTAPLNRFVEQMNIASKYVEAHVTFAYSHYQNPDVGKGIYHNAYKYYFENGTIPETALPAPVIDTATDESGSNVVISGTLDNKSLTACRIYIEKKGEIIASIDLKSQFSNTEVTFSFTDTYLDGKGKVEYAVYAEDVYGNVSEVAISSVNVVSRSGSNIAQGKTYVAVKAAEDKYADDDGVCLTDGVRGTPTYGDKSWAGYLGKLEFIIDLGESLDGIYGVKVGTMGGGSAGIFAPNGIEMYVSTDGENFTKVASKTFPADDNQGTNILVERVVYTDADSVTARYVKICVTTNQSWIFIDELQVIKNFVE